MVLLNYSNLKIFFNPSFTGSLKYLRTTILARQQWIGFEAAPVTQFLCIDKYINKYNFGIK